MRKVSVVLALTALACLLGLAAAQTVGMGEGYSSTQLSFFNSPGSSTFEPNVQEYWGKYVANEQNLSIKNPAYSMGVWMNGFPLKFDAPLQFSASSFKGSADALDLSARERNTQFLTRNVNSKFSINQIQPYNPSGSLTVASGNGTPDKDATGKMMSQNIMTLFSI